MKLVLVRHGESIWNKENLFTGWSDVDLSDQGIIEAKNAGILLKNKGFDFDICFTSYLKRAIHTQNYILEALDREWLPVIKTWKLNERHYGSLQGLNKMETAQKYGEDQVKIWRRSYDVQPPTLTRDDERAPINLIQYREVDKGVLPLTESLKDTVARVIPYYEKVIKKEMKNGKRVLVSAHGNSLRALVKYLENISDEEITSLNIPTGVPLIYEFDNDFNIIKKYFLGNEDAIKEQMKAVENQGKA